ncbi:MAG: hypothetical protein A2Y21_02975 [Clostridiales bacterium GWC2_40_7]|nr:MAG: hypothetical protein A2Y21_02975 [Clostridiales bacterium GWC2_40_7]
MLITGCGGKEKTVTVYTSVDRNFSELVFKDFEAKTGIKVLAGYDTEASKTTGMVNKLVEEAKNPRADVFWNGEFSQTIMLKEKDVLTPYKSKSADSIPDKYKDREGYWTAFGGRARCILVNTDLLKAEDFPSSYSDFLNEKYPADKIAMAYPLFGTTATHAAALYAFWGDKKAEDFFRKLYERGIRIVDGNGVVRDLVVDGQMIFGITDTDDALGAVEKGAKVSIIFPDQGEGQDGTLIVPNTVAMVKKRQQNDNAKVFIDYLLSEETEKYLVEIGWIQAPVRDLAVKAAGVDLGGIKTLDVTLDKVYDKLEKSISALKEIYIR